MKNLYRFKKFFIFSLIVSLVVAALVAVITVMLGHFNMVSTRVFLTLLIVVIHSLVSLMFIWNEEKSGFFEQSNFSINVLFILIVVSFLTSIFGVWKILSGYFVFRLYIIYFIILISSIHGEVLSRYMGKEKYLDSVIYGNYIFIAALALMLIFVTYYMDDAYLILGQLYFRLIGAVAIMNGTASLLVFIFYRLYIHKHPEMQTKADESAKKKISFWVWIMLIFIILFLFFIFRFII